MCALTCRTACSVPAKVGSLDAERKARARAGANGVVVPKEDPPTQAKLVAGGSWEEF